MKSTLVVVVCVVLTVAALPVAGGSAPATAAVDSTAGDAAAATPPDNNSSSNRSMGGAFSTFAQSTAADADSEVEGGMWSAAWNRTGDNATRVQLVEGRTNALEARLDALRQQREQLRERRDELSPVAYRAQLARLTSRLAALGTALNRTENAATEVGVNTTRLDRIRLNASNLTGPEIAEMARELGGGPPDEVPGLGDGMGADDCRGNAPDCDNESAGPGSGPGDGGPGEERGNVSDGPGNGPGGPDDGTTGNGSDGGPGDGPGDGPGGGNGGDGGNGGNGGNGGDRDGAVRPGDTVLLEPVRSAST